MPLSTVAKAALCLCPPAVMAGAVATVPVVKHAVHHLTAEHRPHKPVRRLATAAVTPATEAARRVGCDPAVPGLQPAVPLVTYAEPIPAEPGARDFIKSPAGGGMSLAPAVAALGAIASVPSVISTPTQVVPPTTGVSAVPEPTSWALLIVGVGAVGGALRRRRTARHSSGRLGMRTAGGAMIWSASAVAVEAGDVATTVVVKSAVASATGKALMCVCPAALVAGSVLTVPPLRQAVHAATAIPPPLSAPVIAAALPCVPSTVLPVSAAGVSDLPAVVTTETSPS